MSRFWDDNIKTISRSRGLEEAIYAIYTGELVKAHLAAGLYVETQEVVNKVYDQFPSEIHEWAPMRDIIDKHEDQIDWELGFFASTKAVQLDVAIERILEQINERYAEVIERHPDKKLGEIIEIYPTGLHYPVNADLSKYRSLRESIEKNFTGRDVIGGLGHGHVAISGNCDDYFEHFPEDLKRLSGRADLTPPDIDDELVSACILALLNEIYADKKEAILTAPEKKLTALSRENSAGAERN